MTTAEFQTVNTFEIVQKVAHGSPVNLIQFLLPGEKRLRQTERITPAELTNTLALWRIGFEDHRYVLAGACAALAGTRLAPNATFCFHEGI